MSQAFSLFVKRSKVQLLSSVLLGLCAMPSQAVVYQAEDYSNYSDTTAGNTGGKYRADNVDIESTNDTAGGGYNVGWIEANEWLVYPNLVIPSTGSYTIKMRVVSPSGATATLDLNGGTIQLGEMAFPAAGNWTGWTTVTKTVNINAGTYSLGVFAKTSGWNFNWIEVVANTTTTKVGPAGYTLCADENQTCSFSGTRSVAYGASGSFNYKTATGSIGCNNSTFGDPISGVAKSCYYGAEISSNLPTAYSGYTGVYPGYTLKLDERFDSLNTSIWAKGDGAVGGESMCRFQPQGVQVANGNLELVIRNEYVAGSYSNDHKADKGPYNYSCGELRTVASKRIKYGRIETRMKAPARATAKGYISSLFTYVHEGSPREWEEIDIELEGGRPDMFQANLIYGVNVADWSGTRQWGAWEHKINIAPADQWRVYAIEWTPTAMKWFVDGVLVKTLDKDWIDCSPSCVAPQVMATPVPDNLTDLMMNFWIPNDGIQNAFGGNKTGNVYPMTTQYDWVRIYSLDSNPLTKW